MEWSNDLIVEFLELYEKEPVIWNPRHPQHKNKNHVNDSWQRISDNISTSCTVFELKKKKDSLMSTFRKLAAKVRASTKTGSGAADIYKPDWFVYDIMAKFLHGVFQPRVTRNSETFLDENQTSEDIEPDKDDQHDSCDEVSNNEDIEIISSSNENTTTETVFKIPTTNKKRKVSSLNLIENRMEDAYNILKKVSAEPSRDEFSLYGELLAKKLRALDENTRELAMHEIDNYLYRLKHNRNQLHQNNLNSTQSFQIHPSYPYTFQTHSSQPFHNTFPAAYSTLPSNPSQDNFSPRDLASQHLSLSYNYQPEYSTSSSSQPSLTPPSSSQISPNYSVPSPYSQTSSNIEFPQNQKATENQTNNEPKDKLNFERLFDQV